MSRQPEKTHLKNFGNSVGLYFNKSIVQRAFNWDENTVLEELYDSKKKEIIIREKADQGVTPRIT